MKSLAKTIQIFLPDGNARSIRIAEITSRTVQTILIPRNKIKEAEERNEIHGVGVYFLFGISDKGANPVVYIGEAENCYQRIKQHNQDKNKDFWNAAVVVTSKTNSFTKAHSKFLEYYSLTLANEIGRFKIENCNSPAKPYISEQMEADLMDNFETIKILLSTLGYPIFENIKKTKSKKDLLYCKAKDSYGTGEYTDDGFVVFKGAKARPNETASAGNWVKSLRKKLIENNVLVKKDKTLVFSSEYIFTSPSAAAAVIKGHETNGWTSWKNGEGKTLDELKRK